MSRFCLIFGLIGFAFQSAGKPEDIVHLVYPMVSTYAKEIENCDVDDLNISSFRDVKNICRGLINSEVCSNVKSKYLIDCDNLEIQEELHGVTQGSETSFINHIKSARSYDQAEVDRVGERATNFVYYLSSLMSNSEFSCLNKKGKVKAVQKFMPWSVNNESPLREELDRAGHGLAIFVIAASVGGMNTQLLGILGAGGITTSFIINSVSKGGYKGRGGDGWDEDKAMNSVRKRKVK